MQSFGECMLMSGHALQKLPLGMVVLHTNPRCMVKTYTQQDLAAVTQDAKGSGCIYFGTLRTLVQVLQQWPTTLTASAREDPLRSDHLSICSQVARSHAFYGLALSCF